MNLFVDFETRSKLDVSVVGGYNYSRHPSTQVMCLGWAVDDEPEQIWEPHKEPMPSRLIGLLSDPEVTKFAWNVSFEYYIFLHVLKMEIPIIEWKDVMVMARYLSLPGSLEDCGKVLGLSEDDVKIKDGKRLLELFSEPSVNSGKITLFGPEPDFNDSTSHPADWAKLLEYCKRDVTSERTLYNKMKGMDLPESEWRAWRLDQEINSVGVPVNTEFAAKLAKISDRAMKEGMETLALKTGLANPNSNPQMLEWIKKQGYPYGSLNKKDVTLALTGDKLTPLCREVLELRKRVAKISVKKLNLLPNLVSKDSRLRNQFMFMGAARSGRWSGFGFQPQNMPRPIKEVESDPNLAVRLADVEDYDAILKGYPSVLDFVASSLRHTVQAPPGKKLVVCDLSAIENRGLGWVSGCNAILDVFKKGRDPYIDFGTKMYGVTYDELWAAYKAKDPIARERRQTSKPAVLGAGYGLGPGVEIVNGKYVILWKTNAAGDKEKRGLLGYAENNMGVKMTPEQAYQAWKTFRMAYPEVVNAWYALEKAAIQVLKYGGSVETNQVVFDTVRMKDSGQLIMRIKLPSGRNLHYVNARLERREIETKNGPMMKDAILYDGIGHGVGFIANGWGAVYTYGGKLMENIVQAISRDILVHGMMTAASMGAEIVLHCHDEIVCLSNDDGFDFSLEDLKYCMSARPEWASDFPVNAEGYESVYYKK